MIDKTQAMDLLIAQDADLIDLPAQSDEEGPCLKCNAAGDDCGEHAPSWEELSVYWKAEAERLRQPTQSDALREALERIEVATRNDARAGDKGYVSRYGIHGIARAALEQSPFAQSIPSLHIHLQKTQINRPSNLHKTQIDQALKARL